MKVVFRADASVQIGSGHVMRCLTLAEALRSKGAECHFLCREHSGHLLEHLRGKGYPAHALSSSRRDPDGLPRQEGRALAHAAWLDASQQEDAQACAEILQALQPDLLIVDHYALDAQWEAVLRPFCRRLVVIDDLADRSHLGDLLIDQTFGRSADDYRLLVPPACTVLCGSRYALLRPEFSELRPYSLARRKGVGLQRLLITMGGVDKDNVTSRILEALSSCDLPQNCRITVVMGATAPWLALVQQVAAQLAWPTEVLSGVGNMGELMADSDLAIGAAGATSWERCCLGLPTLMLVLADNQQQVAQGLAQAGAALVLQDPHLIAERLPAEISFLLSSPGRLAEMSRAASRVADGAGVAQVVQHMESI